MPTTEYLPYSGTHACADIDSTIDEVRTARGNEESLNARINADVSALNTEIATKANSSDVTAALALKADSSTVTAALAQKANADDTTAALATKASASVVDDISAVVGIVAPEVAAARVGADETSYQTLKARLDAENESLKDQVGELVGYADSFISYGKNLYNPDDLIEGYGYKHSDGTITENSSLKCTPLIKIENGKPYIFSSVVCRRICFYDENKEFLRDREETSHASVLEASYISFTFEAEDDLSELMLSFEDEYDDESEFEPFTYTLNEDNIISPTAVKAEKGVSDIQADMAKFFTYAGGLNKYDPSKLMEGYAYKHINGELVENAAYKCTPLIGIDDLDKVYVYSSTLCYRMCFYDENMQFIRDREQVSYGGITTAKYVSLTYLMGDDLSELMISFVKSRGETPRYEPIKYTLNEDNLVCPTAEELKREEITFFDSILNDLSDKVETDVDFQKIITLQGDTGTNIWYEYNENVQPKEVLDITIFGKTDTIDDMSFTQGAFLDFRFFDSAGVQIGSKYNCDVVTMTRFGYHRYQVITPNGADHCTIRAVTRGNTKFQIKNVTIDHIRSMPQKQNSSIIYDCHLGPILYAPKNTMAAYEMAKILGFKSVIINFKTTSDDVLVAIHDATIDATSDGSGNVSDYTYDELLEYDFGSWFSPYYTGEKIPKIDDVLRFFATCNIDVVFSVHGNNTTDEFDNLYALCKKYNLTGHCMFKCYDIGQIEYLYSLFGEDALYDLIITSALTDFQKTWIQNFGHLSYVEPNSYSLITSESVAEIKELGCEVNGSITSSPATVCTAIEKGVKRFTSDICADLIACR